MILYIDPGTGSMLFAALLGVASTLYFLAQQLWIKIKYRGGKVEADTEKKELVVFGEGGQYWKVFKPVCDELEKRGCDCEYYTMDEHDPALEEGYEHVHVSFIGSDNRAFAKLNLMKAHICLSTTPGLGVYQWKRSKGVDKYVHVFHAVDDGTGYRMFGLDDYDAVLLTSDFMSGYIRKLEEIRGEENKELRVAGITYLDSMLERKKQQKREGASAKTTVLLAPSWGKDAILSRYGEKIIDALIKTGCYIIIRPHPQTIKSEKTMIDKLMNEYPDSGSLRWDMEYDNFDALSCADILISDFSGIIFDYALVFRKPVIYTDKMPDLSPYDAAWIDEPLWRFEVLKDLGIPLNEGEFDRLKERIDELMGNRELEHNLDRITDQAWQQRGRAALNIVDYLEEKRGEERNGQ